MARIVDTAGVEIQPESRGFADELRAEVAAGLAAATAGQDRQVRIRVTTDSAVAEAQVRRALANIQGAADRLAERIRARSTAVLANIDQRVTRLLAVTRGKVTAWRDQLQARVFTPFWARLRADLDRVGRGWSTVSVAARRGAESVRASWERAGTRVRSAVSRITTPLRVVQAFGVATFRIIGGAGVTQLRRVEAAASRVGTRLSVSLGRAGSATRGWMSALGRLPGALRSATRDIDTAGVRVRAYGRGMDRTNVASRAASAGVRLFGAGLSAATSVTRLASRGLDVLSGALGGAAGLAGGPGGLASALGQVAAKGALVSLIVGGVTFALGAVSSLLTGLPGIALGAAAAIGTVALGFDGVKKAYEAGLKPALDDLKSQLSTVFEQRLTEPFRKLGDVFIPAVTGSLKNMANSISDGAERLVDMATKGENLERTRTIIDRTAEILRGRFFPAVERLGESFLKVGSNARVLDAIGGIFEDLTSKTADWLTKMEESGEAARGMEALRDILGRLEDLFFRVATASTTFFADATPGVGRLVDSTGRLVDFVGSLGDEFGTVAEAGADFIDSIPPESLDNLKEAIGNVADALKSFANSGSAQAIVDGLTDIINTVSALIDIGDKVVRVFTLIDEASRGNIDSLQDVKDHFTDTGEAAEAGSARAGDAARKMGEDTAAGADQAAGALGKLPPAADAAGQGIDAGLTPPVTAIPGTVTDATGQVSFQPVLDAANQVFGALPTSVADGINAAVASMDDGTRRIADSARSGFDAAAASAEDGGRRVADATRSGLDDAAQAAEDGSRRVSDAVRSGLDAAAASAEGGAQRISTSIRSGLDSAAAAAEAGAQRVTTAVRTGMDQASTAAEQGGQRVRQALEQSLTASVQVSEQSWRRIGDIFQRGGQRAAQIATDTGRRCVQAIRSQSGAMYQAGFTLISRLADGMIAAQGRATAAARRTAASIRAQFPASPAKEGPLSGAGDPLRSGGVIVQRLATGIARQAAVAPAALQPILRRLASLMASAGWSMVKRSGVARAGLVQAEDGSWVSRSFYAKPASRSSGRGGMVQAEDGSWVPRSFYGGSTSRSRSTPNRSGMVRAEDGTWVPRSFYSSSSTPRSRPRPRPRPRMVQAEDGSWVPAGFYSEDLRLPPSALAPRRPRPRVASVGTLKSIARDTGASTVQPGSPAAAQAGAGGVDHEALAAAVAQGIEQGIAQAMKPVSATGLARITAKGQQELSRR